MPVGSAVFNAAPRVLHLQSLRGEGIAEPGTAMITVRTPTNLIVIAGLLMTAVAASAQNFDDGMEAINRGDHAEGFQQLLPFAEQGDVRAQHAIGYMYSKGQGVSQSLVEAAHWYRLAADQGHGPSQINLGYAYQDGHGVLQDYVLAHKWFNIAGVNDNPFKAAGGVVPRDHLASRMTPEQIAEAQQLAREWLAERE
jgi:hypothetical protein